MSRIVRTGRPDALYRLHPVDLPDDGDLSFSHFRYVNADGLDLSSYDCSFTDWIDCSCRNVVLPEGGTEWLLSRGSVWLGATIPLDVSDLNHDLVVEAIRQETNKLPRGRQRDMLLWILGWVSGSYQHSWSNGCWRLIHTEGYTPAEIVKFVAPILARWPKLRQRLTDETRDRGWTADDIPTRRAIVRPPVPEGGRIELDFDDGSPLSINADVRLDRWALARRLEGLLEALRPDAAPWTVLVKQVTPLAVIEAEPTSEPDVEFLS